MLKLIRDYCNSIYSEVYNRVKEDLISKSTRNRISESKFSEIETAAQKEAVKISVIDGMKHFPEVEASLIWRAV